MINLQYFDEASIDINAPVDDVFVVAGEASQEQELEDQDIREMINKHMNRPVKEDNESTPMFRRASLKDGQVTSKAEQYPDRIAVVPIELEVNIIPNPQGTTNDRPVKPDPKVEFYTFDRETNYQANIERSAIIAQQSPLDKQEDFDQFIRKNLNSQKQVNDQVQVQTTDNIFKGDIVYEQKPISHSSDQRTVYTEVLISQQPESLQISLI